MSKIILIFLITNASLFAGQSTNNGTGNGSGIDNTIWFTQKNKTIRVCYQVAPYFLHYRVNYKKLISEGLNTWISYINSFNEVKNFDHLKTIATNFEVSKNCDKNTDLTFLFGKEPSIKTDAFMINKLKRSASAALLDTYEIKNNQMWGKGQIWVASNDYYTRGYPNWDNLKRLQATLLHEIGHVFGADHIKGTVMEKKIYAKNSEEIEKFHGSIDWNRHLYFNSRKIYKKIIYRKNMLLHIDRILEEIFERKTVGDIRFTYNPFSEKGITLADEEGSVQFTIGIFKNGIGSSIDFGTALRFPPSKTNIVYDLKSRGESHLYSGKKLQDNKKINFILNFNMHKKFEVKILKQSENYNEVIELIRI